MNTVTIPKVFTAVYRKTGTWFNAWIEEIPGVNTQGRTKKEAQENLKDALLLSLSASRELSQTQGSGRTYRELLKIRVPA